AAAGCSGAANCSASYSSHAEASKTVGGQHGEARATCSGGGSGGSCGSIAVVKVDANSAYAQAGCSGTGACDAHYATRSGSSASGPGIKGDGGGECAGSTSGGYCATGSKATYNPKTGELQVSSYCATAGGTCRRWANIDIDAASPDGQLAGKGRVRCAGGAGSCGLVGVAKYHPASTDKDGNPILPTLVIRTSCSNEGAGSCSQWSKSYFNYKSEDGKITSWSLAECA